MNFPEPEPGALLDSFRDAMAAIAAPVSIVTTALDGRPVGATVSAFASLSLCPPMVVVALDDRGSLVSVIQASGRFGLNILSAEQAEAAQAFARRSGVDRFEQVDWAWDHDLPRLDGVAGWVPCEVDRAIDGGDHTLLLGRVLAAESVPAAPLNYHRRMFGTVTPLSSD